MTRKSETLDSSKDLNQGKSRTTKKSTRRLLADNVNNKEKSVKPAVNSNFPITNAFKVMMSTHSKQSTQTDKVKFDPVVDTTSDLSLDGLKRRLDEDTSAQISRSASLSPSSPVKQHSQKRFKSSNEGNGSATIIQCKNILTESNVTNIEVVDEDTVETFSYNPESSVSLCLNGVSEKFSKSVSAKKSHFKKQGHMKSKQNSNKISDFSITSVSTNTKKSRKKNTKKKTSGSSQQMPSSEQDTATASKCVKTSKLRNKSTNKKCTQINTLDELKSSDIIEIDDDSNSAHNCLKPLAPVFVRCNGANNETEDKNRNNFLYSSAPFETSLQLTYENNSQSKTTILEKDDINILFPRVSHIKQIGEDSTLEKIIPSLSSLSIIKNSNLLWRNLFDLEINELEPDSTFLNRCNQGCNILSDIKVRDVREMVVDNSIIKDGSKSSISNIIKDKRKIIKNWKKVFERFPTFKCFNQMYLRYMHKFGNETDLHQKSSDNIQQGNDVVNHLQSNIIPPYNGEELFIEKYKANVFEEIIINIGPVMELQKFLSKWKSDHSNNKKEFEEKLHKIPSSNKIEPYANTVALVGPISSGKTTAVYALANSMNFNVLEINASMIRNGKRIIQELHESTQSHQVRKTKVMENSKIDSLLNKAKCKKTGSQMNLNNTETYSNGSTSGLQSLLLIEDADVLLDKFDIGFLDAIHTLSCNSKRPIVIVVNDKNCLCLQKFTTLHTIYFHSSQPLNIAKYMCILSLVEHCPIPLYDCLDLYCYNNLDLRKTLHQMHFFIQSGGDYVFKDKSKKILSNTAISQINQLKNRVDKFSDLFQGFNLNINSSLLKYFAYDTLTSNMLTLPVYLRLVSKYLSVMLQQYAHMSSKVETTQLDNTINFNNDSLSLTNICRLYKNLSTAANLIGRDTIMLNIAKNKTVYNSCVDITDYTASSILPSISHYLITNSLQVLLQINAEEPVYAYNPETDRQKREFIHERLYMMKGFWRPQSLHLDYEPCLRTICHSEFERGKSERRCTRFHHYLQAYTKSMYTSCQDIYDETCLVLQ